MSESIYAQPNEEFRSMTGGLIPVFLALVLILVSRTSVSIVIAADGDDHTAAQALAERPPAPDRRKTTIADDVERSNTSRDATSESAAEISDAGEISKLNAAGDTTQTGDGVRTLSVEPGSMPLLPANKPEWVGSPPDISGITHRVFVGSSPENTAETAEQALDASIEVALRDYVDQFVLKQPGAAEQLPLTAGYARKNLLDDMAGYVAELTTSDGPMFQKWVTLNISPEQRNQFQLWHTEAVQRNRLGRIGFGLFVLLGGTGSLHLLLSSRSRRNSPKPRQIDLNFVAPNVPKKGGSFAQKTVITCCLLAVAAPVVWTVGRINSESRERRMAVEARQEQSARERVTSKERKARARHTRISEKDA